MSPVNLYKFFIFSPSSLEKKQLSSFLSFEKRLTFHGVVVHYLFPLLIFLYIHTHTQVVHKITFVLQTHILLTMTRARVKRTFTTSISYVPQVAPLVMWQISRLHPGSDQTPFLLFKAALKGSITVISGKHYSQDEDKIF